MWSRHLVMASLGVLGAAALVSPAPQSEFNALTPAEQRAGFVLLFDGHSLEGWRGYRRPDATGSRWRVEKGLLTVPQATDQDTHGARDLISVQTFTHFDLRWQWRISQAGNSGVKYFVLEDRDAAIGHEYQMIDDERNPDGKIGPHRQTAALYDVLPPSNRPLRAAGEWNDSRVVVEGLRVEHWLNGRRVLQYTLGSPELKAAIARSKFKDVARFGTLQDGHILLQDHGDAVWFRDIRIRRFE